MPGRHMDRTDLPADPPTDELPFAAEVADPPPTARRPPAPAIGRGPPHRCTSSVRPFLTAAVVFVAGFLFLRTLTVEPFGVPTGSMAPALIGNHREGPCPRCGFPVRVGVPSNLTADDQDRHFADVTCPNCGKARIDLRRVATVNGDRLLVDKNVFGLRKPRRWEVAVFWRLLDPNDPNPLRAEPNPLQRPDTPYVKRVVGLPGEVIGILDGDVFANGMLLRKGLAEVRETRVLVFEHGFAPPGGWGPRWLVEPPGRHRSPRSATADGTVLDGPNLVLDATRGRAVGLTYRNWNLDTERADPVRAWDGYNGPQQGFAGAPAAHDFFVVCEIEVPTDPGEGTFAARLFDGADSVHCELSVGRAGVVRIGREGHGTLAEAAGRTLEPGRTYKLEFAFVDRRVSLAVDGREPVPAADLPAAPKRGDVGHPLQFGAAGCRVTVRNMRLYRDIHYTHYGINGTRKEARLGPTEYFVLGDNSGNSEDSRKWPNPGVPESDFIGKPFLIHQPLRLGRVTVAGRDRAFQTLDWSRLRWVH